MRRVAAAEAALRDHLGVPVDAPRVMIVTESTHWDPDWLFTSREYFRLWVRPTLDRAIDMLVAHPRRVFSVECAFFADLYWTHRPERRVVFRNLVNEGRLRFTGSGVTTPDTLLPEDELLLRDLLIGQEWLRSREMTQEPRLLYLPDSFGHSPGVPSLLRAAGVEYAAICRIDGMRFPGADLESASKFPRPGTSAHRLIGEGTADFVWRGPDGSEVLTHWHTFGYGHGDMIASGGLSRALGLPTAWPDRRERHVASRIDGYIAQLAPLARTPYLLLAIGFDFVRPVPHLVDLLDRWNESNFERSGVWLVNAGLDDYLDLVACHRDVLPTIELDPNPYWSGFYASRPDLKSTCKELGRRLIHDDNERARMSFTGVGGPDRTPSQSTSAHDVAWWTAVTSNHHDFVTGTSPDRVAKGEQSRLLASALAATHARTDDPRVPASRLPDAGPGRIGTPSGCPPHWERDGHRVVVTTDLLTTVFDERRGGALVSLKDPAGTETLGGPSLVLNSYRDSGGLWRMGFEFNGGRWTLGDTTEAHPARITVTEQDEQLTLAIRGTLDKRETLINVEVSAQHQALVVRTTVSPPARRTVTLTNRTRLGISTLTMHQPGGVVTRDLSRWYDPTFWPMHSFAIANLVTAQRNGPNGCVLASADPTAIHAASDGTIETVVARTATKEIAFGVVPVLAPAWGRKWGTQGATVVVQSQSLADPAGAMALGRQLAQRADRAVGRSEPDWFVVVDDPAIEVITVKTADRGYGLVARLRNWDTARTGHQVLLRVGNDIDASISQAWRIDSNERNIEELTVEAGAVRMTIDRYLTSVRLVVDARILS